MNKQQYQVYLQSEYWKDFAKYIKEKRGNKCQLCSSGEGLNVHHSPDGYKRLWREYQNDSSVTILCGDCHTKHHARASIGADAFYELLAKYDRALREIIASATIIRGEDNDVSDYLV